MEFIISKEALQRELGFLQGTVEKKNTIPQLCYVLVESLGAGRISFTATDLDLTARCEVEVELSSFGSVAVHARKLFDIVRLLPDAPVTFRREKNDWVTVECLNFQSKIPGLPREAFAQFPTTEEKGYTFDAAVIRALIERTVFAITQEESRYTLSGAKFIVNKDGARMVATDGHRLAYVGHKNGKAPEIALDVLIPRKTLAELGKLLQGVTGELSIGASDNHIFFRADSRLLISRTLSGQFPDYEMVMPKGNDKLLNLDCALFNSVLKRVALMADSRSHAVRLRLREQELSISSESSEEGEAAETLRVDYSGGELEIGFNAQYLLDFLSVVGSGGVIFEIKDGNSQAQLRPAASDYDFKYICMPMRL